VKRHPPPIEVEVGHTDQPGKTVVLRWPAEADLIAAVVNHELTIAHACEIVAERRRGDRP
jgi:hypothetical protein